MSSRDRRSGVTIGNWGPIAAPQIPKVPVVKPLGLVIERLSTPEDFSLANVCNSGASSAFGEPAQGPLRAEAII